MANIANIIGKLTSINTSLGEIKNAIVGGSNTDYDNLTNKPQINSVTLSGNKTSSDLGLVASASVGVASGVAELDNTGHVPSSQLPSYVDDVVEGYYDEVTNKFYEENTYTTEIPGETGKIYITLDTNLSYRYTGSGFVVVSPSLALGETSSTAYRGDRGKIAYDTSQSNSTAIGNINTLLGNTSISGIGDGTVTGAISALNTDLGVNLSNNIYYVKTEAGLLIQFGRCTFPPASSTGYQTTTVSLPQSFSGDYSVIATWNDNINTYSYCEGLIAIQNTKTANSFELATNRLNESSNWYAHFVAIGSWK